MRVCKQCGIELSGNPKKIFCTTKCKDIYNKSKPEYKAGRCAYMKQHREVNINSYIERDALYYIKNKHKFFANNAKRRAMVYQATPLWADLDAIKDVYLEASYYGWHVDHIIPLRGELVCGLHVWDNLQILPPKDNLQKGNRFAIHDEWT